MSVVRPFRGVHYNPDKIDDIKQVVCPPYDVISPQQQQALHQRHPYNFIHLLLGLDQPQDTPDNNRYTRARELYRRWLKEGVLTRDPQESFYFYRQEFKVMGQRRQRLGFIGVMKIDEQRERIHPHEKTHDAAKEDRYRLWTTVGAALSPIFVCYSDTAKKMERVFAQHVAGSQPLVSLVDDDQVQHTLWRVSDQAATSELSASLRDQPLFIADGHHRYEVARRIRDEYRRRAGRVDPQAPYEYVMTYFTDFDNRGLTILPMHRVVKHASFDVAFLEETFRIDKAASLDELNLLLAKAGRNEHAFGLIRRDGLWLLRLKNRRLVSTLQDESEEVRHLDATILKRFVLDPLGVASDEIHYTPDADEAAAAVASGQADAVFLMNPVSPDQLKRIALAGETMPPKTTYFYPKVLSGLTIYPLHNDG